MAAIKSSTIKYFLYVRVKVSMNVDVDREPSLLSECQNDLTDKIHKTNEEMGIKINIDVVCSEKVQWRFYSFSDLQMTKPQLYPNHYH